MDKIKEHIKVKNDVIIVKRKTEIDCNHKWVHHGHGFLCEVCDYYTGQDEQLNGLIRESL